MKPQMQIIEFLLHLGVQQGPSYEDLQDKPSMLPLMLIPLMMAQLGQR
jgi:hypothetical protein